jgi:hypothetical protein
VVGGLPRVFADQVRLELLDRGDDRPDAALDRPFTDADDAGVGVQLDEDRAQCATGMISILVILIADRGSTRAPEVGVACAPRTRRSLASRPVIPAAMLLNH